MKTKVAFVVLALGILILIAAAAFLSRQLFNESIEGNPVAAAKLPPAEAPVRVTETVIEAGAPAEKPRAKADPVTAPPPVAEPVTVGAAKDPAAPVLSPPPSDQPGIGAILNIRGTATATTTNKATRMLMQKSRVFLYEQIETTADTKLKIRFDDGSELSQGASSVVVLDEYVYDPAKPADCGFAMRVVRGVCRVVTGLITKTNPDRFRVKTRMATVGIRGCDVSVRTSPERDDIYVMDLAGEKKVVISTTKDGTAVLDPATGKELPVEDSKKIGIDITEPGNMVAIVAGKGVVEQRPINQNEIRDVMGETSYLPPARHDLNQRADGATFTIQPGAQKPAEAR